MTVSQTPGEEQSLYNNNWTWSNVANVIYVESPAGVGFSYSNTTSDYVVGDARTSRDLYVFLQEFFAIFQTFAGRGIYITGESYAGHYTVKLAQEILEQNQQVQNNNPLVPNAQVIWPIRVAVGNAWTDAVADNAGAAFQFWSHQIISDETYFGLMKSCNMSNVGPLMEQKVRNLRAKAGDRIAPYAPMLDMAYAGVKSAMAAGLQINQSCDYYQNVINDAFENLDIYDLVVDVCLSFED
jgi:serine carboxypeptidase-like clade 2